VKLQTLFNFFGFFLKEKNIGYFSVVLVAYLFIFGWILTNTNGMPYVMDNNESYSSVAHANSLSKFGLLETKGLADEALGQSANAHPYVHSHQGNFPRLFAWVIFELGATTVAEQIWVTTFSIGLFSIFFAFAFFSTISNPQFAMLCCLIFLTDYIFFVQWQVVTYRVWYGFVFFLQFFAIECWVNKCSLRWLLVVILNTVLFCYGELIFAAFLGLASLMWLIFRGWGNRRTIFLGALGLALGLIVALMVLVSQGISYMGVDNFLEDIQITFGARNNFDGKGLSIAEIASFYSEKKVIFWENLQSRSEFIGWSPFIKSISSGFIKANGPIALMLFVILFVSAIVFKLPSRFFSFTRSCISLPFQNEQIWSIGVRYFVISFFVIILMAGGFRTATFFFGHPFNYNILPVIASAVVFIVWLIFRFELIFFVYFIFLTLAIAAISISLPFFFTNDFSVYWINAHGKILVEYFPLILPLFVIVLVSNYLYFQNQVNGELNKGNGILKSNILFLFLLNCLFSYAVVYHLSPGYIFSGYINRDAPFLVYFADVALAISLFAPFAFSFFSTYQLIIVERSLFTFGRAFVANLFLLIVVWLWLSLQIAHFHKFSPVHFDVFQKLHSPPFKNASFIVNTYAAPIGVQTGQWAYMDDYIGRGMFVNVDGEKRLIGDRRYLWLADKDVNPTYRRPEYFICLLAQTWGSALSHLANRFSGYDCLNFPLVKLAMEKGGSMPGLSLVEFDKTGLERVGFVSWAIVKFDWDSGLGGGLVWKDETDMSGYR
jgi:hypothetical protein